MAGEHTGSPEMVSWGYAPQADPVVTISGEVYIQSGP